jgi:protein-glucosylgalactosylhydroxylysine glucosidase
MRLSRRSFLKRSSALVVSSLSANDALGQLGRLNSSPLGVPQTSSSTRIPKMVVENFSKKFDPAYLSNGLIGIRPGPNPLARAMTHVSGYVFAHFPYKVESLSPAPYPLETDIVVNNTSLLKSTDLFRVQRQTLDMSSGELLTEMIFSPEGSPSLNIEVLQFASRSVPSLICQQIRLLSSADLEIQFVARINNESVPGQSFMTEPPERTNVDLVNGFVSDGGLSKLGIALTVVTPDGSAQKQDPFRTAAGMSRGYVLNAGAGRLVRFQTIAAVISSLYHPEPALEAIRLAEWGAMLEFDYLRDKNRDEWNALWQSRLKVTADTDAQPVLDAAFFYLHSSLHRSARSGMPPFGLSQHDYYYGHSFWDTETWSLLPVVLTAPETARALMEFRLRSLPWAKSEAALYGYRGAQFPWEAAQSSGFETTPTFAATGWAEQHVTSDVGLGFWEYQLATNDQDFLKQGTWPVLKAVAEWIASRGVRTDRGFEIQHIMGPDEAIINVNDDVYVNVTCKMVLAAAIRCGQMLGEPVPTSWSNIQNNLVLPMDAARNVLLAFDNSNAASKQEPGFIDCLTVHDPPIDHDLLHRTYAYEENIRQAQPSFMIGFAADAVAATAAFLGDKRRARALFDESWKTVWLEPFGMIREVPTQDYGCFLTNFGSLLQTAMLGFTGLRINEGDWRKYPASMPQGWSRIEIDRIWVKGEPKHLIAADGAPAKLLD